MDHKPLLTFVSHIDGKNATVSVYPDRIEWDRKGGVSGAKLAAGALTMGLSLAATGVKSGKGAGTEMIPVKSMSSVTTEKDGMRWWKVRIITAGNTIDFRVSKEEAESVKAVLTQLILGSHPAQQTNVVVPPPAPAAPAELDAAEQLVKLAALRDQGILTEDEFTAKKAQILGL